MSDFLVTASAESPPVPTKSPQILVVDDDAVARRLLTISLEGAGFIVESVGDGEAALSFISEHAPDVLVLDFEMPGLNGAEVCARLRSSEIVAIKELPVIMLTAHSTEAEELACLRAFANDFVTKPVSRAVLHARILTQLRLRGYAKEMEQWKAEQSADLNSARAIQQAMVPANLPQIKGWEVQAEYQPLIEVGGDIYGWEPLSAGRWLFWLADGTGHGVAAALITALTAHLFGKAAEKFSSPADILTAVNEDFTRSIGGQTFMTACCAIAGPDGSLQFSSAGHPPILVRRRNEKVESHWAERTILGVENRLALDDMTIRLEPGDLALLYTDGLYAMKSKKGGRFTHEIVEEILAEWPLGPDVIRGVMDRIAELADGSPTDDDLTAIMLRRRQSSGRKQSGRRVPGRDIEQLRPS